MRALAPRRAIANGALAALVLLFSGGPAAGQAATPAPSSGPRLDWRPDTPVQGRLFVLRVSDPGAERLRGVDGRSAGERLHFHASGPGVFESLVPVPVDATGDAVVELTFRYRDGGTERVRHAIPIAPGSFRHARLTVAPQFGRPPTEDEAARRARDAAKARAVSEAAHGTPRLWTADVVLPRNDRVTSGFGDGREFNGQISSRHMGLDLDGEPGDTVYAAARGVVELVDEFLLAGNIVYLNHGAGLVSGYFHLTRQLVAQGDTVSAGTPIGLVGATGRVTGPHLHWVVRYGYVSVDPRSLLEAGAGGG
ncbi:MAG TPA: M23 family metallopeptidase [Longimicrobiales bacterium]|nr:M23 family metallopeptidase [Longimicrobiales bacterium]